MPGQDEREFFGRLHRVATPRAVTRRQKNAHPQKPTQGEKNTRQSTADAFTSLVARCPLLNVRTRDPDSLPVDTDRFSCFGVFEDPDGFRAYANGTAGAPRGSVAAKSGAAGTLGAAAGGRGLVGVVVAAVAVAAGGAVLG